MLQDRKPMSRHGGDPQLPAMDFQAENQIKYIRDVMSRATTFTAVPGKGMILMGIVALIAASIALLSTGTTWLFAWLGAVLIAPVVGFVALFRKARRTKTSLRSGVGQKFIVSFSSCLLVGLILSVGLWRADQWVMLPGIWMLMYGVGTVTGGALSIRIIPMMGVLFILAGGVALFVPLFWGNLLMAVSFGGFHLVFGVIIARYYGG